MAGVAVKNSASNFSFLAEHDPLLATLGLAAERAFSSDPNTTLIKLRQLGEALAQHIAARMGIAFDSTVSQLDLLGRIGRELQLDQQIRHLFHTLRVEGNRATHEFRTQHKEAMDGLRVARSLAIWFHQTFGKAGAPFKPGPFVPPHDPSSGLNELQQQIEALRAQLQDANQKLDDNHQLNTLLAQEKHEFEQLAVAMDSEARQLAEQAKTHEQALASQQQHYEARLQELQAELAARDEQQQRQQLAYWQNLSSKVSRSLELDEKTTRALIDQQLRDAGWEADTQLLDYRKGARPEAGVNRAIAEYPAGHRRADYVLFCGLVPMAIVEAKRGAVSVAGMLPQAEDYSRLLRLDEPQHYPWQLAGRTIAWADSGNSHYQVPFIYACNGRGYVAQLAEQSGIWFRDLREAANCNQPLQGFHSPAGLLDRLKRSREQAEAALQQESFGYLRLRNYQQQAIVAVEQALASGNSRALLAMATGTGKTRTIIGLLYRFLKSERFRRILFLVDRTALGEQALGAFKEAPLEQNTTLWKSYTIAELGDMGAEAETRVQVATVQAMVKRIWASDNPPPVDQFDCIIIDEAHRGYTLDQEMSEGELATRDAEQYLSSYRRVLDYFDAVKIGLTATPARHTSEIFGRPVYTYSYREAVADDWLIDHEPPIRYLTLLNQNGIHFNAGEEISSVDLRSGEVSTDLLDDDLHFDVEAFNKRVINEDFNRVICTQLAAELNPFGDEKTLIFCATDNHADMVKRLLDDAFHDLYGDGYNQALVAKITGKSPDVGKLISRYKNEPDPNIAITVDLLTTGIDVPRITNLVFMRRVKSRILYEQMKGRATRRCDEIGKTVFRIFDPVDLYATLEAVDTMKPLVKDPNIPLEQLLTELADPQQLQRALAAPGDDSGPSQAHVVLNQLSQKLMRVLRKAQAKAEHNQQLRDKLGELGQQWGVEPAKLHQHLHQLGPEQAATFLHQQPGLLYALSEVQQLMGSDFRPVISSHNDELLDRQQSYGAHSKPQDYLDSFNHFVREQLNQSAALAVVVNRPRDLTRAQLREIRLLLDSAGYSEAQLSSAVRNQTNQEIAAGIIGHIRQAAMGEALQPFEQRVEHALQRILANHPKQAEGKRWTPVQQSWLKKLAKQLVREVVLDRETLNQLPVFAGGAKQLDKVLDDQLDTVLGELAEWAWQA